MPHEDHLGIAADPECHKTSRIWHFSKLYSTLVLLVCCPLSDAQFGVQSLMEFRSQLPMGSLYSPTSSPCLQQIPCTILAGWLSAIMNSVISVAGPLLQNKLLLELMLMSCNDFVRSIWEWEAYQCVKQTNNDRSLSLVIRTQALQYIYCFKSTQEVSDWHNLNMGSTST